MNTKNKITAILMASVMVMATVVPMAMGGAPSQTAGTSAQVGNEIPEIIDMWVEPDPVTMKPCQEGPTEIKIVEIVQDTNGVDDIASVVVESISPAIDGVSPPISMNWVSNIDDITARYEVNISLPCCTPADTYTVTNNVTDNQDASSTNTTTFEVLSTKALDINFDKVSFGPADPGTNNVPGIENITVVGETVSNITNQGNDPIDVGVLATNLTKSGVPDIDGNNMEANVDALYWHVVKPEHTWPTNSTLICLNKTTVDFQLDIPPVIKPGTYTGSVTITAH